MNFGPRSDIRIMLLALIAIISLLLGLSGCVGITHAGPTGPITQPVPDQLTVALAGGGKGTVSSAPAGINCGTTCSATFANGTSVTLTAAPGPGVTFGGWGGACSGTTLTCSVAVNATTSVSATFNPPTLQSITHIIFLAQENRGFDHYFGALREYWAQNGIPDQAFDGLPQFNIPAGAAPSNPGCDPTQPPPADCKYDPAHAIASYHLPTQCIENPSPSWNESHVDWSFNDPPAAKSKTAALDGFVWTAAHDSRNTQGYLDVDGVRAMGYYDGSDLNYYYFMASNFATSDRWFSPVMSRTQPNRMYLIAGTSQGRVYPLPSGAPPVNVPVVFQELQNAGITWKIYVQSQGTPCADTDSACLINFSSIGWFTYGQQMKTNPTLLANVQSVNQYKQDAINGTLPNVALIEPAYGAALDEHPTVDPTAPTHIQAGAAYISTLINTLMNSKSWANSMFILTFDEGGGLYDHVAPQPTVSPDGIKPSDLLPGDICTILSGATCDFTYTGYRVPLIVVSPYTKKNFVSHTAMDYTAILKLIETRFNVPALTKRDAVQPDMSIEFLDFSNPQWITPPKPPAQNTNDSCTLTPPAPG
jgi:phospholipase C